MVKTYILWILKILKTNYNDWGNETTGYSIFTSITRLTIAAFSNNGFINYQNAVDNGMSIFNGTTKMKNGETYKINDFLYGIVFDPLHIEAEFDKFMGEGYYRTFCEYLDRLFYLSLTKQKLPSAEVKRVMNILPDFINKKINYYRQKRYYIFRKCKYDCWKFQSNLEFNATRI